MFFKLSSFVLAAVGIAGVAAIPVEAPAPKLVLLFTACTNAGLFGDCAVVSTNALPSGCANIGGIFADAISSIRTGSGIQCTLFADNDCHGQSIQLNGQVDDLSNVSFNDVMSSYSCRAD